MTQSFGNRGASEERTKALLNKWAKIYSQEAAGHRKFPVMGRSTYGEAAAVDVEGNGDTGKKIQSPQGKNVTSNGRASGGGYSGGILGAATNGGTPKKKEVEVVELDNSDEDDWVG
jgi:hypothetical protein